MPKQFILSISGKDQDIAFVIDFLNRVIQIFKTNWTIQDATLEEIKEDHE